MVKKGDEMTEIIGVTVENRNREVILCRYQAVRMLRY